MGSRGGSRSLGRAGQYEDAAAIAAFYPASGTPEQLIEKAKADVQKASQQLAEIEVPMNIEPAFHFSAR